MRKSLLVLLLSLGSVAFAQTKESYAFVERDSTLYLDFYRPDNPRADKACVVSLFGGGFFKGTRDGKLQQRIASLLTENHSDDTDGFDIPTDHTPYVILVVGVNGVGKTTTIGKLAYQFKQAGKSVYLGAADTFRAAAVEQLCIWGERVGVPVVKQQMGSDPASVAFDTVKSAVANNADVVIIDTAGRLHNKVGLMNELTKIRNVIAKVVPQGADEVLLVLDGSTGQNAFEQARQFTAATDVTALAITKLD